MSSMAESSRVAQLDKKRRRLEEMVKAVVACGNYSIGTGIVEKAQLLIQLIDEKIAADQEAKDAKFKGGKS